MLGAGLRAAEAAALCVSDVGRDGSLLVRAGKGDQPRIVYLTGQALEAVIAWLVTLEHQESHHPLFPSRKRRSGQPSAMRADTVVQLVAQLMAQVGIANASSHSLRRTHACGLRDRAGADLLVIRQQLGHSSIAVTQIYLARTPADHRERVRGLEFKL